MHRRPPPWKYSQRTLHSRRLGVPHSRRRPAGASFPPRTKVCSIRRRLTLTLRRQTCRPRMRTLLWQRGGPITVLTRTDHSGLQRRRRLTMAGKSGMSPHMRPHPTKGRDLCIGLACGPRLDGCHRRGEPFDLRITQCRVFADNRKFASQGISARDVRGEEGVSPGCRADRLASGVCTRRHAEFDIPGVGLSLIDGGKVVFQGGLG